MRSCSLLSIVSSARQGKERIPVREAIARAWEEYHKDVYTFRDLLLRTQSCLTTRELSWLNFREDFMFLLYSCGYRISVSS